MTYSPGNHVSLFVSSLYRQSGIQAVWSQCLIKQNKALFILLWCTDSRLLTSGSTLHVVKVTLSRGYLQTWNLMTWKEVNSHFFYTSVKHPKLGNVMLPIIHFPVNICLIWNQIPVYTAQIDFLPEHGWLISYWFYTEKWFWLCYPEPGGWISLLFTRKWTIPQFYF